MRFQNGDPLGDLLCPRRQEDPRGREGRVQIPVLVLMLLYTSVLAAGLGTQQGRWPGRWVNVDPTDVEFLVLDIEADGAVHRLIPAPQFSATYRVEGRRLVMRAGDGSVDSSFALQGDTLLLDGKPALARLSRMPAQSASVGGTWRPLAAGAAATTESFMTFRSDGQVVLEVGFPVQATVTGDTLRLVSAQGPSSFTVRQATDTLYLSDGNRQRRFVRRPWGCLGMRQFDAPAVECRE